MEENEDQSGNLSGSGDGDEEGEEGGPLDGAALLKAAQGLNLKGAITSTPKQTSVVDDIDGIPCEFHLMISSGCLDLICFFNNPL